MEEKPLIEQRNEEMDYFINQLQTVATDDERSQILKELIDYFTTQKPIVDELSRELLLTTFTKLLEVEHATTLLRIANVLLQVL